jgi:NAD(P)-dependent dehydrogenase (short-subunit alcohol dehydrogenase family)
MSVVLITGCSSGIGLSAAVEFARRGADVVATMRDLDRATALRQAAGAAGVTLDVRRLDVNDEASVTDGVGGVIADHAGIDIVVSNAGVGVHGTTEELSVDDFRNSFDTNVLGSVRLLHAVLPGWRVRGSGRFVAVSSIAGAFGQPFNDAYCASKCALEGMLESLAPVVARFGVQVAMVEPGPVVGEFRDKSVTADGGGDASPYAAMRGAFMAIQEGGYEVAQTNAEIATVIADVAFADAPVLRYQTSEMVSKMVGLKLKDMTGERVVGMTGRWL